MFHLLSENFPCLYYSSCTSLFLLQEHFYGAIYFTVIEMLTQEFDSCTVATAVAFYLFLLYMKLFNILSLYLYS